MKKLRNILVVLVIVSALFLAACGTVPVVPPDSLLDAIKQRGYILVSTDPDYAPLSSHTEAQRPADTICPAEDLTTDQMEGFDVDVAKAIGDHLNVETCFSTPGWDAIVAGGWEDKWDVSVGSMTITTERQNIFDFSVPYYYAPAIVAVRADKELTSIQDLSGQALCVGIATTYETWLNHGDLGPNITVHVKAPDNITVIPLDTDQRCPEEILAGRDDFIGYVTSETVVDTNIAAGIPIVKLGEPVFNERLAAAFDKTASLSTESLRAVVDSLFTQMHADGTLTELSKKWFKDAHGDPVDYTIESN